MNNLKVCGKIPGCKIRSLDKGIIKTVRNRRCYAELDGAKDTFFIGDKMVYSDTELSFPVSDTLENTVAAISKSGEDLSKFIFYLIKQ